MMLSSELLSAPLLDHRGLDLDAASRVTYVLRAARRDPPGPRADGAFRHPADRDPGSGSVHDGRAA